MNSVQNSRILVFVYHLIFLAFSVGDDIELEESATPSTGNFVNLPRQICSFMLKDVISVLSYCAHAKY